MLGLLLVVFLVGAALTGAKLGFTEMVGGMFMAFCVWSVIAFMAFLWGALSTNSCVEYGYPELSEMSNGKSCSDEEILEHIEKTK